MIKNGVPRKLSDIWRRKPEGLVIFSDTLGNLHRYTFNPEAAIIWNAIDGERSVNEVISAVAKQARLNVDSISDGVISFLRELDSKRLIYFESSKRNFYDLFLDVPDISLPIKISKVLLFVPANSKFIPPESLYIAENSAPPLGLMYIAAVLEAQGIEVKIVDLSIKNQPADRIAQYIKEFKPDLVGTSVLTCQMETAIESLFSVKQSYPEMVTVAGGIHATVLPQTMLKTGVVDYAVIGEGEHAIIDLVAYLTDKKRGIPQGVMSAAKPDGINYLYGGARKSIQNLDSIPEPARHLVDLNDYLQRGSLISSRGCIYQCKWCSGTQTNLHPYRRRSVDGVINEMKKMNQLWGIDHFHFQDDNFAVDSETLFELCNRLKPLGYIWSCQGTIREIIRDLKKGIRNIFEDMVQAGCRQVFFGIETGNDQLLKEFRKGIDQKSIIEVIESAQRAGVETVATSFIIGHPEDDKDTIKDTQKFIGRLRDLGVYVSVAVMTPFPGSMVHDNMKDYGIDIVSREFSRYLYPNVNISTRKLTATELREAYFDTLEIIHRTYAL